MPELPEVQTVINTLTHSGLLRHRIVDVKVNKPKLLKNSKPTTFCKFLKGEMFINIERIGKYLIFKLSHDKVLVIHLRMEGKIFYEPTTSTLPSKHLHIEISLDNHHTLRYYDSRMFGTFHIYHGNEHLISQQIKKLALDPLNPKFNDLYLKNKVFKVNRAIKTAILDQTNVSGIGNIYADEILFLSKIHPATFANKLTDKDFKNIAKYSKQVLTKAIKYGGTTVSSYKSDPTHAGRFQATLLVHTRKDQPCPICHTIIKKMKVNGRGTYYCPQCQKVR